MAVLTLGVMGVAMLIPIGKFAMSEVEKADRTGACGRAGLRDVKVQRMLNTDPANGGWTGTPNGNVAVIDPLGVCEAGGTLRRMFLGGTTSVGGTTSCSYLARISFPNMANAAGTASAEASFLWHDDLNFVSAKDSTSPTNGDRPMPGGGGYVGSTSWFFTVTGTPSDYAAGIPWAQRKQFTVSVVVCYKRDFRPATDGRSPNPEGEQSWLVQYDASTGTFTGGFGIGGGTIMLVYDSSNPLDSNSNHPINKIRENQWVMLVGMGNDAGGNPTVPIVANWYRVVGVGRDLTSASQPVNMLSLVGPDWPANTNVKQVNVVAIDGVTGVYTRTMDLDDGTTWSR